MSSTRFNFTEGEVLLIDKPAHWTSFDVVKKIRNLIKIKKIGHAGTLDPLATGLLILCTGKKTKTINDFMGREKEYTGEIILGQTTPSADRETEPEITGDYKHITEQEILDTAASFIGDQQQVPPIFSALKVGGERLYKKARKGEDVKVEPREVHIDTMEITAINLPYVSFRIVCSKGTYIRSIARDFGEKLGCGGYLYNLRRTRIGDTRIEDAYDLEQFIELVRST